LAALWLTTLAIERLGASFLGQALPFAPFMIHIMPVVPLPGAQACGRCDTSKMRKGVFVVRKSAGFSLIELMIVLAVIAIIAAIALPNYNQYLIRSARADAQACLMEMAQRQQQILMDARAYADEDGLSDAGVTCLDNIPRYTFVVAAPAGAIPPTFTITATPQGPQDGDGNLVIDQAGTTTRAGAPW
jgi:type IV pilus assembly protein PilE